MLTYMCLCLHYRLLEEPSPTKPVYRPVTDPEIVYLILVSPDREETTKAFILDSGRLKLESVKHAFSLATVELIIGTSAYKFSQLR